MFRLCHPPPEPNGADRKPSVAPELKQYRQAINLTVAEIRRSHSRCQRLCSATSRHWKLSWHPTPFGHQHA